MPRRIPNLNQLKAFEAAARLGSFRDAGDELSVTHSAVSHQIKALEQYFGAPLFHRNARGVQVTEPAQPLFNDIRQALDLLAEATANFKTSDLSGKLTVSIAPSFASRWLLKRLGSFREQYPAIAVEPDIASTMLDFGREQVDLAIRHGSGDWRGLTSEKLFDETLWLVGAPQVAASIEESDGSLDLTQTVLLTASVRIGELNMWLAETSSGESDKGQVISYPTQALALDGAVSGLGVALADYRIVEDEINEGRLEQISDRELQTGRGYYLVWPKGPTIDAKSRVFRDWLLAELAAHSDQYS